MGISACSAPTITPKRGRTAGNTATSPTYTTNLGSPTAASGRRLTPSASLMSLASVSHATVVPKVPAVINGIRGRVVERMLHFTLRPQAQQPSPRTPLLRRHHPSLPVRPHELP